MRTSISHPLQIAEVETGQPGHGLIGVTFCPGKVDPHGMTGAWNRDLALDLDAVRDWGAVAVVTLLEAHEFKLLRVDRLGEEVSRRDMMWFHLPIVDTRIPDEDFERKWEVAGEKVRSILRGGSNVMVHCREGSSSRHGCVETIDRTRYGAGDCDGRGACGTTRRDREQQARNVRFELGSGSKIDAWDGPMDWFEKLTGFAETNYADTRAKLKVKGSRLHSLVSGESFGIGELELVTLQALRVRQKSAKGPTGRLKARVVTGNVREMHRLPEYAGALFQVASQFNLLEMIGPSVTPDDGVGRYENDPTQGPACAIAAGAATIYRNYFAPVGGALGQTAERQLDGLADLGDALSKALNQPVESLWTMQNGYAQCTRAGLDAITKYLRGLRPEQVDALRGRLCIGIHRDVEVTEAAGDARPLVPKHSAPRCRLPTAGTCRLPTGKHSVVGPGGGV